ncbi:sex comb on midleg-like protein 4 isoform X3 [Conger conger]|uniref:sex comb on midleg-like protein 4 isoform X3 n=1 Tax=Conger conger TaxID=82655 RepID=UPI002A59D585|nr:sex comb on midleg-like protein 4 isoform X3 [Conger conger]
MRLRGRDLEDSPVSWIPNILGVQSVRLRLRLDRRDNKGRGCWQLVDLGSGSEQSCRKLRERDRDRTPPALSQSPMSIPAASAQKTDNSEMQSPAMSPSFISGPRGKIPGRKRGRPPIRNVPKMDFQNRYSESLSPLKVPKKRGRKPGFKLKPRLVMTPLAISPPSSTPEPDMSSIPQDAATVPHSATPQVLTATFDGKQHLLSLPVVNSVGYVLRFLKKLCRSLHCENLFSDQPIAPPHSASYHFEGHAHSTETSMPEDYLVDPIDSKRYSVDPSDSAFNTMSSPYPPKPYGYRACQQFPGGATAMGLCRQPSSPSTFQEGNRSAYSPSPESQESKPPPSKDPSTWSVEDVVWFVKDADPHALGPHVEVFRKHEIDGYALLLLKSDMIMKYLGLKLGPALKLCYHIDKLKQAKF